MFCLVINEKIEIMSIDSGSKIKDYKIVDTVLITEFFKILFPLTLSEKKLLDVQ
jgi:hypothetical protein